MTGCFRVEEPGTAVVTDLGRTVGPRFGLATNGALDQYSAKVANVLVANHVNAPLIELTAFGMRLCVQQDLLIAITGAELAFTVNGSPRATWQPILVARGDVVELGPMTRGLRAYLAVRGSLDVPRLLGSCAPDPAVGFGSRLRKDDEFTINAEVASAANPHFGVTLFHFPTVRPALEVVPKIYVTDGPDIDEFGADAQALFGQTYTVSPVSNHVGLRLTGGPVPRRLTTGEILSRAVPIGAVEAPPGDELLVLHRGRGVTAGYPVLGVVTSTSLDTLAQVRPAQQVRFERTDVRTAIKLKRSQHQRVLALAQRVRNAFDGLGLDVAGREQGRPGGTDSHDCPKSGSYQSQES